jgi:hypothetical protein
MIFDRVGVPALRATLSKTIHESPMISAADLAEAKRQIEEAKTETEAQIEALEAELREAPQEDEENDSN